MLRNVIEQRVSVADMQRCQMTPVKTAVVQPVIRTVYYGKPGRVKADRVHHPHAIVTRIFPIPVHCEVVWKILAPGWAGTQQQGQGEADEFLDKLHSSLYLLVSINFTNFSERAHYLTFVNIR